MNDEQVTFGGIPIPLTLETILSAMDQSWEEYYNEQDERKIRQFNAFRVQILRMEAEKNARIDEYRKEVIEKDEEIRVLEKYIKDHDYKTILDYMEKYLEEEME